MVKSNYGDPTNVAILYTPIAKSVSVNLLGYAMGASDAWVETKIQGISKTTTPAPVQIAAEYKAMEFILRNLNDAIAVEMPTADWYIKEATSYIGAYIEQTGVEESSIHPYSSSKTPNKTHLRTTLPIIYLPDEYYYAVDESGLRILRRRLLNGEGWEAEGG